MLGWLLNLFSRRGAAPPVTRTYTIRGADRSARTIPGSAARTLRGADRTRRTVPGASDA